MGRLACSSEYQGWKQKQGGMGESGCYCFYFPSQRCFPHRIHLKPKNTRYAMHEWAWEWFLFYFIFGPLMMLERVVKSATVPVLKKKKQEGATPLVPAIISFPLRGAITNVFTLALAGLLFCPPNPQIQYSILCGCFPIRPSGAIHF